jgi:predicted SprT family Zn-dependent metalloprotease
MNLLPNTLLKKALEWVSLWGVPELLEGMSVERNGRLRATVARWVEEKKCVELGPRFFRLNKHQSNVLCHELAHAAAVKLHGKGVSPHGPEWCALIRAAGYAPSSKLRTAGHMTGISGTKKLSLQYEHRCLVCHSVRYAKRRMISWKCVECVGSGLPGQLEIRRFQGRGDR